MKTHINWTNEIEKVKFMYWEEHKSLQEIGDFYNVTRENIRRVMAHFGIKRGHNYCRHPKKHLPKYSSLEELFEVFKNKTDKYQQGLRPHLYNLVPDKFLFCQDCGSRSHIHIHHVTYPASKIDDMEFLCASCHFTRHRKGMTRVRQLSLLNDHNLGMNRKELALKYNIDPSSVGFILRKLLLGKHTIREIFADGPTQILGDKS